MTTIDAFTFSATGKATIIKDANAVLDYVEDWALWLDASSDSLQAHSVTLVSDNAASTMTKQSSAIAGQTVAVWLAGGIAGETVAVTVHIITVAGREDDRTFYVKVKER